MMSMAIRQWGWAVCALGVACLLILLLGGCVRGNQATAEGPQNVRYGRLERPASPGAWVQLHDQADFSGQSLWIGGPVKLDSLQLGDEGNWNRRPVSLIVGPNAWVRIHKGPGFTGGNLWLLPNQRARDLSVVDFDGAIESMEIFDRPPNDLDMRQPTR